MKKVVLLAIAVLLYIGVNAQIVSSRSVGVNAAKSTSETLNYFRAGINMMKFAGDADDSESKTGYSVTYGFMKPMGSFGMYWGMEFGLGSRGGKSGDEFTQIAHNVQYSPFHLGYRYGFTDALKVDVHVGAYASFDYAGKIKIDVNGDKSEFNIGDWNEDLEDGGLEMDWRRYDVGLNAGIGIWYNNFNLDFNFQRGFIEAEKDGEYYTSNFMIRLGIAF